MEEYVQVFYQVTLIYLQTMQGLYWEFVICLVPLSALLYLWWLDKYLKMEAWGCISNGKLFSWYLSMFYNRSLICLFFILHTKLRCHYLKENTTHDDRKHYIEHNDSISFITFDNQSLFCSLFCVFVGTIIITATMKRCIINKIKL